MCSEEYQELVGTHDLPRAHAFWDTQEWWFQRDNAPRSLAWFKEHEINLLVWPPASPDLTPLDCSVWSTIEARVQRQKPTTVDHLRKPIVPAFDEFSSADGARVVGQYVKKASGLRGRGSSRFEQRRKWLKNVVGRIQKSGLLVGLLIRPSFRWSLPHFVCCGGVG